MVTILLSTLKIKNKKGDRFGRLVLESKAPNGPNWVARWNCLCDCGAKLCVQQSHLRNGNTKSCGCYQRDRTSETAYKHTLHGQSSHSKNTTEEYRMWDSMMRRCYSTANKSYKNYGARGIVVCERWHNFINFFDDLGKRPKGMSIGRIDNNGSYEPHNVRWENSVQQNNNRRDNIILEYNGNTFTVKQLSKHIGLSSNTIYKRINKNKDKVFEHDGIQCRSSKARTV